MPSQGIQNHPDQVGFQRQILAAPVGEREGWPSRLRSNDEVGWKQVEVAQ